MKAAIFNVKYSANLGDGVIAECLERALSERTGWTVQSIDLAGRTQWADGQGGWKRALALTALRGMPQWMRDHSMGLVMDSRVRKRLRPTWRKQLEGVSVAILGGGQLIQDGDLNFPIKLAAAAEECRQLGIAMALFAVGASRSRSRRGRALFEGAFRTNLVYAAARDEDSRTALRSLGCAATLCRDPGLLAARIWPAPSAGRGVPRRVGLGITHPALLAHHASRSEACSITNAIARYEMLAEQLSAAGYDVLCFTNGAAEDELLLSELASRLPRRGETVRFVPRCKQPRELAQLIAGCDAIVAHRLHAAIVAYSYRIPAIGLRWDDKLASFFQSVGLTHRALAFNQTTATHIAEHVALAIGEGIDPDAHARVIAEAEAGIDRLIIVLAAYAAEARFTALPQAGWVNGAERGGTSMTRCPEIDLIGSNTA